MNHGSHLRNRLKLRLARNSLLLAELSLSICSGLAQAKVSAQEAKKLGSSLTPAGAEQTGTKDGVIPPWEGGITSPPASYVPGEHETNPFSDDGTRFVVTSKNMKQYENSLSDGHKAMFKRYPDTYSMPVYPTRRSASYPQFVYDAFEKNAKTAELLPRGAGVRKSVTTSPFPIPQAAVEVVWNHLLRFRGEQVSRRFTFTTVDTAGKTNPITLEQNYLFNYSQKGATTADVDNKLFMWTSEILAPAKLAGTINLVHESLDQIRSPRKAWRYQAGERRLRRSPYVAYDAEFPSSAGLKFIDQVDMYNGAPDQYEWKMLGKKEMLIPYNAYRLSSDEISNADILKPGHINPELTRYELHRVWAVEGERRVGIQHGFAKRRMYFDEDSWQVVMEEGYGDDGALWRFSEGHLINYYSVPVPWTTLEATYDLKSGQYFIEGLDNDQRPRDFEPGLREQDFSTSSVRRAAKR